jgi:hypothetical protein
LIRNTIMKKVALAVATISILWGLLIAFLATSGISFVGSAVDTAPAGGFSFAVAVFAFFIGAFQATLFQIVIGVFVLVGVAIFGKKKS